MRSTRGRGRRRGRRVWSGYLFNFLFLVQDASASSLASATWAAKSGQRAIKDRNPEIAPPPVLGMWRSRPRRPNHDPGLSEHPEKGSAARFCDWLLSTRHL